MDVIELQIPDVKVFTPAKHGDHRGYFAETFNRAALAAVGIDVDFVQDNQSFSAEQGVVRGLHYQIAPFAQDKLVRVLRGSVLDVAVDIRRSSPTFGQHVAAALSADGFNQIFVPIGFAHGFVTLEPDTEVFYKVSNVYAPDHERGLMWNDPALNIDWPITADDAVLSGRDREHPTLSDQTDLFD